MTIITGGCLCGNASYKAQGDIMFAGHCYCVDCRRASGTGHSTHAVIAEAGFSTNGEVHFFAKPADSGNLVRRGFCPRCGSQLYSTNDATPGLVYLRASSLDDTSVLSPGICVYVSRAPAWDQPPTDLPGFAAMPPAGPATALET